MDSSAIFLSIVAAIVDGARIFFFLMGIQESSREGFAKCYIREIIE